MRQLRGGGGLGWQRNAQDRLSPHKNLRNSLTCPVWSPLIFHSGERKREGERDRERERERERETDRVREGGRERKNDLLTWDRYSMERPGKSMGEQESETCGVHHLSKTGSPLPHSHRKYSSTDTSRKLSLSISPSLSLSISLSLSLSLSRYLSLLSSFFLCKKKIIKLTYFLFEGFLSGTNGWIRGPPSLMAAAAQPLKTREQNVACLSLFHS